MTEDVKSDVASGGPKGVDPLRWITPTFYVGEGIESGSIRWHEVLRTEDKEFGWVDCHLAKIDAISPAFVSYMFHICNVFRPGARHRVRVVYRGQQLFVIFPPDDGYAKPHAGHPDVFVPPFRPVLAASEAHVHAPMVFSGGQHG